MIRISRHLSGQDSRSRSSSGLEPNEARMTSDQPLACFMASMIESAAISAPVIVDSFPSPSPEANVLVSPLYQAQ